MPRDPSAMPIQGPDNGTGNPIPVTTTPSGTQNVNITQVAGVALAATFAPGGGVDTNAARMGGANISTDGSGRQRIIPCEANGAPINGFTDTQAAYLTIAQRAYAMAATATAAANTAVVVTLAAGGAGTRHLVPILNVFFTGANAAVILTITDGATAIYSVPVPAGQNTLLSVPLPVGGLLSGNQNAAMVITLPAGGGGVVGFINYGFRTGAM